MSAGYTSQPLVVQPWCNHAETTVGYINGKGRFMPLADCSIGPDYAVDYEPLARLLASAPDLLAERNQLKALNAELVAVLETIVRDADGRRISGNLILDENNPVIVAARAVLVEHKGVIHG